MVRKRKGLKAILVGLLLLIAGAILTVCTLPVFTHTRQELVQVLRSESVLDGAFDIHELEGKLVQFQISIGQSLDIYAASNGNMSFLIANFTDAGGTVQADVYFALNNTLTINMTWSPQSGVPDPGIYYLAFLTKDASPDSPLHVYANATKTWTDYEFKDVVAEDRISLLDQNFVYVGSVTAVFGAALSSINFFRSRKP